MNALRAEGLGLALDRAAHSDSRLVLLIGESPPALLSTGRDAARSLGWPVIDLNVALSERLLPLSPGERQADSWDALDDLVGQPDPGVVLVGTDVLFEPALGYRAYEALRRLGRRGPVVATWLGRVEGQDVIRAAPGHPEYTRVRLDVPYVAVEGEDPHP